MVAIDWSHIKAISYSFQAEPTSKYAKSQEHFARFHQDQLSGAAIEDMFTTQDDVKVLLPDALTNIRMKICDQFLVELNISDEEQRERMKGHIIVLLADTTFRGNVYGRQSSIRDNGKLNDMAEDAQSRDEKAIHLELNISKWQFRKKWQQREFLTIYLEGHETPSDSESDDDSAKTESTITRNPSRSEAIDERLAQFLEEQKEMIGDILMNNFQQPRQQQSFYYVVGSISLPVDHAGARYSLLRFASSEGLYPKGDDATTCKPAFETFASPKTGGRSVLKFALVFPSINSAAKFIDNVVTYLKQSREMLYFCDDEGNKVDEMPSMKAIASYPIAPQHKILLAHYVPSGQDTDAPDSPVIDVLFETRSMSEDATAYVTVLSKRDEVFLYQRIEAGNAFALADPESAHIFPSAKCIGQYKWLDDKPFNRLALSRDLHLNFDGTGRGRGKRRKTVQTLAMRPLQKPGGYAVVRIEDVDCYEIPLEIVINDNTKAAHVLARLPNHAQLNRKENAHWTITGADVRVHYPRNRRVTLIAEIENDFSSQKEIQLVTAIPGVRNLSDCWSNSPEARLSVEAAEILEKCLLWNYEAALSMWSSLG